MTNFGKPLPENAPWIDGLRMVAAPPHPNTAGIPARRIPGSRASSFGQPPEFTAASEYSATAAAASAVLATRDRSQRPYA